MPDLQLLECDARAEAAWKIPPRRDSQREVSNIFDGNHVARYERVVWLETARRYEHRAAAQISVAL
jgi:hypothetical protein